MLVITGNTHGLSRLAGKLAAFRQQGGTTLIATDLGDYSLTKAYGVYFRSANIAVDPVDGYQGLADCPLVTDFNSQHPLFDGVRQLVTNKPGFLYVSPRSPASRFQLAWLPSSAPNRRLGRVPLVAAVPTNGRMLLVADHSVFINEMLLHGDNAIFAWNCVNWLCEDGRRQRLVFIDEGNFVGGRPLDASQLPPIPVSKVIDALLESGVPIPQQLPRLSNSSLREVANGFITSLEDKDFFNASLAGRPRGVPRWAMRRWVGVVATAAVGLIFLRWLMLSRWRPERNHRPDSATSAEQRAIDSHLHVGRFEYCATALAREFFSQDLEPPAGTDWQQLGDPRVDLDQPLGRMLIRRHVRQLWKVATCRNQRSIRQRDFDRLVGQLARLQGLRRAGRLRLQWPSHEQPATHG